MPNALLAIKKLSNKFERIIVVTNQQGIGKALMTIDELSVLHELMKKEIIENGGKIDKIYFCPHLEKENCDCRKPAIGMIKRAIKDFPTLNLKQTFLVGDSPSDIEAGERAGIKTVKVNNQFTLFDWANEL